MDSVLSHLSDEEIETLMECYYNGVPAKVLVVEYQIKTNPSKLYKAFPPEKFPNYKCEYCGSLLVATRPCKSMVTVSSLESRLYCPRCGHKPYLPCDCDGCKQAAEKQKEERIKNIQKNFGEAEEPVFFYNLPFQSKVYLGALCRAYLRENLYEVAPVKEKSNVILAPSEALRSDIYNSLIHSKIISPSPLSPIEAFAFDDNNWPGEFYTYRVVYNLNLLFPATKQDLLVDVLNPSYYAIENQEEALELWKMIAMAECIEYLQYSLEKIGFEFSPGKKTYATFEILLEDFSVSQIYGIIWRAVADASKMYLERKMPKKHAANSVIGACERYAERAKIGNWELTKYKRPRDLPQSELSRFFFYRVIKIGDEGFNSHPHVVSTGESACSPQ